MDVDNRKSSAALDGQTETGWSRVKQAYKINPDKPELPTELYELFLMSTLGMLMGYMYGGVPAARHARQRYIEKSNAAVYHSRIEATGASYNAGTRGFIRYGYRWGWRTALLAGGFQGISSLMAVYRDKQDFKNYLTAAVITGSLFRFNLGLQGLVGGAFVGSLVGIPAGLLLIGLQKAVGETTLERNKRERRERELARQKEMIVRQGITPLMLDYMEDDMRTSGATESR